MSHLLNEIYQSNASDFFNKNWLPVLWWQGEPAAGAAWLQMAASSTVIIIVLLLALAVVILAFVFWRRARRVQQAQTVPGPQPVETLPPPEPTLPIESVETISAPPRYSEDMAKTQPSPLARAKPPAAEVTLEQEPRTLPVSGRRPANINWQIAGLTDMGLKREQNEDTLLMVEATMPDGRPVGLYVVADGLGGHQQGELASQLAIDAILNYFNQHPPTPGDAAAFEDWLKQAAYAANQAVLARQEDQTQSKKMGSTAVMALVVANQAHLANVGDSRVYCLNRTNIEQISVDHSLVERLVQIGQLTREEARTHKNRNVLYNSLGDKSEIDVGLYHRQLQPGDRLLLCSDGLSGMITDEEIFDISRTYPEPAAACVELVRAAKAAGGSDNITAIIVQMDN